MHYIKNDISLFLEFLVTLWRNRRLIKIKTSDNTTVFPPVFIVLAFGNIKICYDWCHNFYNSKFVFDVKFAAVVIAEN